MKNNNKQDERGMVAMIVTLIMMIVITLILLGFSEATRRNQREALDTQLGTQAYYAAEAGVNDVANAIKHGTAPVSHADCSPFNFGGKTLPRALTNDTPASIANTCVMVDANPPSLVVDSIAPTTDTVVWDVKNAAGNKFTKLFFSWTPDSGTDTTCSKAVKTYPTVDEWECNRALLRVDIIKAGVGVTDASSLATNTATLYLQPSNSSTSVTIDSLDSSGNGISAYQGACQVAAVTPTDPGCTVTVTLNDPGARATEYYMRLTAVYATAKSVSLRASDTAGTVARFADGQIVIDSTGRAQDQVKRIKVRIPLSKSIATLPIYAVQSAGSTCKDSLVTSDSSTLKNGDCQNIWP